MENMVYQAKVPRYNHCHSIQTCLVAIRGNHSRGQQIGGKQRWAPGEYNPRTLGVSLGISGHRTDLVQEISKPDRDQAHTERELINAGPRTDRWKSQTERIGLTVSNTRQRSECNEMYPN